jgi:hypothetical protein
VVLASSRETSAHDRLHSVATLSSAQVDRTPQRCEGFPDAHVDELLDVRRALADPLIRFRGAVVTMTRELDSTPVDEGLHAPLMRSIANVWLQSFSRLISRSATVACVSSSGGRRRPVRVSRG